MPDVEKLTAAMRRLYLGATGRANRYYDRICPHALTRLGNVMGGGNIRLAEGDEVPEGWLRHVPFGPFFVDAHLPPGHSVLPDGIVDRVRASETSVYPDFGHVGLDLPRSMAGGGRMAFGPRVARVGMPVRMTEQLLDVKVRQGREGILGLVTVRVTIDEADADSADDVSDDGYGPPPPSRLQSEELDFIRFAPRRAADAAADRASKRPSPSADGGGGGGGGSGIAPLDPATGAEPWRPLSWSADERALFRYSAATHNAHRIHYDYRWATEQEGYPALVVHGPLLQHTMMNYARASLASGEASGGAHGGRRLESFSMRAIAPSWCAEELTLTGGANPGADAADAGGSFVVRVHNRLGVTVCEGGGTTTFRPL